MQRGGNHTWIDLGQETIRSSREAMIIVDEIPAHEPQCVVPEPERRGAHRRLWNGAAAIYGIYG